MNKPTLDTLIDVCDDAGLRVALSRDEEHVIISYGRNGYLRLTPDYILRNGEESPAAEIRGHVERRNGATHEQLREILRAAGIEPR